MDKVKFTLKLLRLASCRTVFLPSTSVLALARTCSSPNLKFLAQPVLLICVFLFAARIPLTWPILLHFVLSCIAQALPVLDHALPWLSWLSLLCTLNTCLVWTFLASISSSLSHVPACLTMHFRVMRCYENRAKSQLTNHTVNFLDMIIRLPPR